MKDGLFDEKEQEKMRESAIKMYCEKKGWVREKLTPEQLFEITNSQEYKAPGLILS